MSFIITSDFELNKVAAPNMPLPPLEYDRVYFDQMLNILRLYFNRIDALTTQLMASGVVPPLTNYTVATLPSAVTSGAGARSFVTDALGPTFGATVVTGGAVAVPVYSDGTNWKVG
jgi:hypothetical protein|tara:strand:+ start:199 stop:546 length:348 start_codon:yes stop_codon:yes gene_type:complete